MILSFALLDAGVIEMKRVGTISALFSAVITEARTEASKRSGLNKSLANKKIQCARHCVESFPFVALCATYKNPVQEGVFLFQFHRKGNQGRED